MKDWLRDVIAATGLSAILGAFLVALFFLGSSVLDLDAIVLSFLLTLVLAMTGLELSLAGSSRRRLNPEKLVGGAAKTLR